MEVHETHEKIHEVAHGAHDPDKVSFNRRIAVAISVLAALLAIVEAAGKSAQNNSIAANIEASNLWAFFQAKTIRMTTMETAADALEAVSVAGLPEPAVQSLEKKVTEWRATAQRYRSEPETNEGRKELAARAKAAEEMHQTALASYHLYEYGSAALQISIVLCSAAAVTGTAALAFAAGGLSLIGLGFALLGWLAPTLIHL